MTASELQPLALEAKSAAALLKYLPLPRRLLGQVDSLTHISSNKKIIELYHYIVEYFYKQDLNRLSFMISMGSCPSCLALARKVIRHSDSLHLP